MPNGSQLFELPEEEQTQNLNISTQLVVNQPLKHPENETSTTDNSGATMLLTVQNVEKLQASMYPYFSAMAGPAGENPEVRT